MMHYSVNTTDFSFSGDLTTSFEDGIYLVTCIPLELTGYGYTKSEALKSFDVMLNEYIKYTVDGKRVEKDLVKYGFKLNRCKDRIEASKRTGGKNIFIRSYRSDTSIYLYDQ